MVLVLDPFGSAGSGQNESTPDSQSTQQDDLDSAQADLGSVTAPDIERSEKQPDLDGQLANGAASVPEEANFLQVNVVSSSGESLAAIPVAAWFLNGDNIFPIGEPALSNDEGIAMLALPEFSKKSTSTVQVGFPFPCADSKPIKFLPSAVPEGPVTLTFSGTGTGTIEVQLLGPDDKPWPHPMSVSLAPNPGLFAKNSSVIGKIGHGFSEEVSNEEGRVTFTHAALGKPYVLGIVKKWAAMNWGEWGIKSFTGPTSNAEPLRVEMRLNKLLPVVHFRILDPEGEPVRNRAWNGQLREFTVSDNGGSFRSRGGYRNLGTDAEGFSYCAVPSVSERNPWTARELLVNCVPTKGAKSLSVRVDLTRDFPPGIHEIEDIQLVATRTLIAGNVQASNGQVLKNLTIAVSSLQMIPGNGSTYELWDPMPVEKSYAPNGSFSLSGSSSASRLQLEFVADGFQKLTQRVEAGTDGHSFVLEPSFVLTGRIEVPEDESLGRFSIYFVPPGSFVSRSGRSGNVALGKIQEDGSFLISPLEKAEPGAIAVFNGGESALLRIEDILPVSAHVDPDPRINPIRIGAIYSYQVSFVDDKGKRVTGVKYRLFKNDLASESGATEDLKGSTSFSNKFELSTQQSQEKIGFWTYGFQYAEQIISPGETVITLKESPTASFQLDNQLNLPDGMELRVELKSSDGGGLVNQRQTLPSVIPPFLPPISLPPPGVYYLKLTLRDKDSRKGVDVPWQDGSLEQEYVVTAASGQSFHAAFPNENIQKAAEELRAQNDR